MARTTPTADSGATVLDSLTEEELAELREELPRLMHKVEQLEEIRREATKKVREEINGVRARMSEITHALLTRKIRRPAQKELPLGGKRSKSKTDD